MRDAVGNLGAIRSLSYFSLFGLKNVALVPINRLLEFSFAMYAREHWRKTIRVFELVKRNLKLVEFFSVHCDIREECNQRLSNCDAHSNREKKYN